MNGESWPVDSRPGQPEFESGLDLPRGNPGVSVRKKECRGMGVHVGADSQVFTQPSSEIGTQKARFRPSSLGMDGEMLGFQIHIGDVQADQLRKSDPCAEHKCCHHSISLCNGSLPGGQFPEESFSFRLGKGRGRLPGCSMNFQDPCRIAIDDTGLFQPSPKGFQCGLGSIDGDLGFSFPGDLETNFVRSDEASHPVRGQGTRTETLRAHNEGRRVFYREVGIQKVKWLTA